MMSILYSTNAAVCVPGQVVWQMGNSPNSPHIMHVPLMNRIAFETVHSILAVRSALSVGGFTKADLEFVDTELPTLAGYPIIDLVVDIGLRPKPGSALVLAVRKANPGDEFTCVLEVAEGSTPKLHELQVSFPLKLPNLIVWGAAVPDVIWKDWAGWPRPGGVLCVRVTSDQIVYT